MNYRREYDQYWNGAALASKVEVASQKEIALQAIEFLGRGSTLDVGCGRGSLVEALLANGVDALGVDVSGVAFRNSPLVESGRLQVGSALSLPFADNRFENVTAINLLENIDLVDVPQVLAELRRVATRYLLLKIQVADEGGRKLHSIQTRNAWEKMCFEAGFRKHPNYYGINDYQGLQQDGAHILIPLEKIPDEALRAYPLSCLAEERGLHMDMFRESGSRSDAHVFRYHLASQYVRPGDVVLDAACGLGYGSYVIQHTTKASRVLGIDGSDYAVAYADANFAAGCSRVGFQKGFLPQCLAGIPDHSVDMVLSFETLEHVEDPEALLAEFQRVLTPGGRIVVSVPNDWRDETGKDPNPYHLQVYQGESLREQISNGFEVECFFAQSADRCKNLDRPLEWKPKPRTIEKVPRSGSLDIEAEWWLAVACKPMQGGREIPFVDRCFEDKERQCAGNALEFQRDYENPWLIRAMVSIGLRTESAELIAKWAEEVIHLHSADSADAGAALCVRLYPLLKDDAQESGASLLEKAQDYLKAPAKNPNVLRWQVSLSFVMGLLALRGGNHEKACGYFTKVLKLPVLEYSPTLLTKTAESAWYLGLLVGNQGRSEEAAKIWQRTAESLYVSLGSYMKDADKGSLPDFVHREITSVISLASRLFTASKYAGLLLEQPRVFHQEILADALACKDGLLNRIRQLENWSSAQAEGRVWLEGQLNASQMEVSRLKDELRQAQEEMERSRACAGQEANQADVPPKEKLRVAPGTILLRELNRLVKQGKRLLGKRSA